MNTLKAWSVYSKANHRVPKLLSGGDTNTKTNKNKTRTFIMYVAPSKLNDKGVNLCPKASPGCLESCLNTAGRGRFDSVSIARRRKANYLTKNSPYFFRQLAFEIEMKAKQANKTGEKLAFRLNGTTDVDMIAQIKKHAGLDVLSMPNTIFYDYTAILGKAKKYLNTNYLQTFSRKENNDADCIEALKMGVNVAAVFADKLPETWNGYKVVDGDITDLEMANYNGVILGLKAKGDAKKDTTGFVIR